MNPKYLAPILPYLAVWAGLFLFKNAWLTMLGFHAAIALTLILLRPALPFGVFFKPSKYEHVLANVLLCASSGLGLYLLRDVFAISGNLAAQLEALGLNDSTWFGFIAYFALVNPLLEEYFWRGVLGSETKGFYLGDLTYAGYHIMVVWNKAHPLSMLLMFIALFLAGWLWRQMYRRDESLLAPVLGHMAADLSILIAVYKMV